MLKKLLILLFVPVILLGILVAFTVASQADGAVNMFEFNVNLGQAALASTMVSMLAHKKLMQSFQESPNQ